MAEQEGALPAGDFTAQPKDCQAVKQKKANAFGSFTLKSLAQVRLIC